LTHFIALIEKESESCFGVSFPDWPGCFSAGDTLDEAIENAAEALTLMAEDWTEFTGTRIPTPRTIDQLREDTEVKSRLQSAVVAAIPLKLPALTT
jgi:predicted RNase H-like HicB family nuclease